MAQTRRMGKQIGRVPSPKRRGFRPAIRGSAVEFLALLAGNPGRRFCIPSPLRKSILMSAGYAKLSNEFH
jgi:hypothetical protein